MLDLDAMTLLGTVPVGRDPVDIDGPRHVVLDEANELAYVVLSYPFSDPSPHAAAQGAQQRFGYVEALQLSDLSVAGDLRVDPNADEIAFSSPNGLLSVSHYDTTLALQSDVDQRRANVILVDEAARAITTNQPPPRSIPAVRGARGDGLQRRRVAPVRGLHG